MHMVFSCLPHNLLCSGRPELIVRLLLCHFVTLQFPAYPGYLVVETIAEPSSFDTRAVTQL